MLLKLPPELLKQILHTLDPDSFYACLLTSKTFRDHAINSTKLVKDHIGNIPGKELSTCTSLVNEFCIRALKSLDHGGATLADMHAFRPTSRIDWSLSTIVDCTEALGKPHPYVIEVQNENGIINIYAVGEKGKRDFRPQLAQVISTHFMLQHFPVDADHPQRYHIVKVAVCEQAHGIRQHCPSELCGKRIAVLYSVCTKNCACTVVSMKLVIFEFDPALGPKVVTTFDFTSARNQHVVGMAVSLKNKPLVLYRWFEEGGVIRHKFAAYNQVPDDATGEPATTEIFEEINANDETPFALLSGISIHKDLAHLYPSTYPIPLWTVTNLNRHDQTAIRRNVDLPDTPVSFNQASLGKVLGQYHHCNIEHENVNGGNPTCVNTALQLMIARDDYNPSLHARRTGIFLIKAIQFPSECEQFDRSLYYWDLNHTYVGYLAGFGDLNNLSTLGIQMAVSAGGHRIAMANWRRVLVWAIDPDAFLRPRGSEYDGFEDDYAYIEQCGWEHYDCNQILDGMVVLQPVQLPEAGVVFGLEFRGENELWGWTEKGLVRWNFGAWADGKRDVSLLQ
jgi:hypothetical protein